MSRLVGKINDKTIKINAILENGTPGPRGLSAYEVWLEEGNEGTVDDYLASIKGDTGEVTQEEFDGLEGDFNQHKLDYATQVEFPITNLIKNGDFSNGTASWESSGTNLSSIDGVISADITGSPVYGIRQSNTVIAGHKYYLSQKIRYTAGSPSYIGIFSRRFKVAERDKRITNPTINTWYDLSYIISPPVSYSDNYISANIDEGRLELTQPIYIDLTETFGEGNEPTIDKLEKLIELMGGWFDGTASPTNKQLVNKYLESESNNIVKDNLDNSYRYWLSIEDGILQFNYEEV